MSRSRKDYPRLFLRRMLLVVARVAVMQGVKVQEMLEEMKRAFIQAAHEELQAKAPEAPPTASKVAVITGLQRRDVARLQETDKVEEQTGEYILVANLLGRWQTTPEFRDSRNRLRPISCRGASSEFAELVRSINRDLNPYTVLFELERTGVVRENNSGDLVLVRKVYEPPLESKAVGFEILSDDVEDLVGAVVENIQSDLTLPNLHIRTSYDSISMKELEKVKTWLITQGSELHKRARKYLSSLDREGQRQDARSAKIQVTLGTFSRVVKTTSTDQQDDS